MSKTAKRILTAVISVVCAAVIFILGFITCYFTQTSAAGSLSWALSIIEEKYYQDIDGDIAGTGIDAIVDEYLDQYSEYYTAEEYAALVASNSGKKSGIGVSYSYVEGKGELINYVMGNSPAYKNGLREGEYITGGSIDGEEVTFTSSADFTSFISSADDGEQITLYGDSGTYVVEKSTYTASYAYLCTNSTAWFIEYSESGKYTLVESESDKISYLPDGAGYIKLLQFYGNASMEVGLLLLKFYELGCDTLYFDLRTNGGGYVSVMQEISTYFVGSGNEVMRAVYKGGSATVYNSKTATIGASVKDTKIYVLANSGTASASEALIGVLISYGVIDYEDIYISYYSDEYIKWLGTDAKNGKTYGKGIMQETMVNASTGEALKLTTAKIYWPNGNCIHDVGLSADDGCTLSAADWVVTKDDEELKNIVLAQ